MRSADSLDLTLLEGTTIQGDGVYAGNSFVPIRGYGEVDILLQSPKGPRALRLYDVAHCEDFACNLVSLRQLRKKGYWWDNRGTNNFIRDKYDQVVATLIDKFDQFVIEDISATATHAALAAYRRNVNSYTARPPRIGDGTIWHLRLGHPGPEVITQLQSHTRGVRLKGPTTVECQACGKAKAKRQIRREPREGASRSGQRIAIDFTDFEEDPEGYRYVMFATDRYSGYIWDIYLKNREQDTLITAFRYFLGVLKNQDKVFPQVFECDNEILKNHQLRDMLQSPPFSIRLEPSALHTQAQNGGAERSGGVIKEKATAMRSGAKLPSFLIVYIFKAAVYLYNRTPKYALFWQSPYEVYYTYLAYRDGVAVLDRKPQQAHLRVYGCMAYAMTAAAMKKEQRLQKLNPKAWIGFLVGYRSTNIYEIWNPLINKVIAIRDVLFNEKATFSGDIRDLRDDLLHVTEEELQKLLRQVELPDQGPGHPNVQLQEEDEDLSGTIQLPVGQEGWLQSGTGAPRAFRVERMVIDTPITSVELLPNPDLAHPGSVNKYQKKIGSILYVAVNTRPDIAFAVSRLARFNLNPSDAHHKAADRVILYLIGTKTLALQFGGKDSLDTWSDASFADNTIDRKSSQAYVMRLFGGVIGWRANKQDRVTTSTTEAELLSLAQAAKEALFSFKLIRELGVTLDAGPLNMWCDNRQTIRLINADVALLQTKLRHVDIHNHWLREAAERNMIRVDYTPTGDMLADGLTKALSREPFRHFREQLGLVDVTEALNRRRNNLRVISEEELADQEDLIAGGEVEWNAAALGSVKQPETTILDILELLPKSVY
ncbi:hypothetical protein DL768_011137 [Monosporascus sp. mg162]|nr:hypothetical protein DL768_011137 [Monosporascus sp. mg162]